MLDIAVKIFALIFTHPYNKNRCFSFINLTSRCPVLLQKIRKLFKTKLNLIGRPPRLSDSYARFARNDMKLEFYSSDVLYVLVAPSLNSPGCTPLSLRARLRSGEQEYNTVIFNRIFTLLIRRSWALNLILCFR